MAQFKGLTRESALMVADRLSDRFRLEAERLREIVHRFATTDTARIDLTVTEDVAPIMGRILTESGVEYQTDLGPYVRPFRVCQCVACRRERERAN